MALPGETVDQPLTLHSSLAEVAADPEVLGRLLALFAGEVPATAGDGGAMAAMMASIPIGRLPTFTAGRITSEQLQQLLDG